MTGLPSYPHKDKLLSRQPAPLSATSASLHPPLNFFAFLSADHQHTMALLSSSASLRACARPTVAPRAPVVAPRPVVVCRATAEDALKVAQDLLTKGMDAAKNVDANQVCADVCGIDDIVLHAEGMHALRLWLCTSSARAI